MVSNYWKFYFIMMVISLHVFVHAEEKKYDYDNEILNEKMKVSLEDIKEMAKRHEPYKNRYVKTLGQNDGYVSERPESESEVHAAINPTDSNNIVVSGMWYNYVPGSGIQFIQFPVYYTRDFGKTWNLSKFSATPSHYDVYLGGGGDPVLEFDADGNLYFSWLFIYVTDIDNDSQLDSSYMEICWARSTDGGETWVKEENHYVDLVKGVCSQNNLGLPALLDKQWIAVDRTDSPYRNNLYASYYKSGTGGYKILVRTKENNKIAFNNDPVRISGKGLEFAQYSNVKIGPEGEVHVTFVGSEDDITYSLYHAVSKDGGKTFSDDNKISDLILNGADMLRSNSGDSVLGITRRRLYPCPFLAVDGSHKTNNVYLSWTADGINGDAGTGKDIYFCRSTDGGETWEQPVKINDDFGESDQFYSCMTVNDDGVIALFWFDKRDHENERMTHIYMTYSFDGGKTFIKNFRMTTLPADFSKVGLNNDGFGVGEYNQLLMTDGYAIPVWADGSNNDGDLDIKIAKIPLSKSGISGVEQISSVTGILNDVKITPIPNDGHFVLSFGLKNASDVEVSIFDLGGNRLMTPLSNFYNEGAVSLPLSLNELPSGVYYLRISSEHGMALRQIVINK